MFATIAEFLVPLFVVAILATTSGDGFALCADGTGEGYITATDALFALTTAVSGIYDANLDIRSTPYGETDGAVTASDALRIIAAAVGGQVPACAAADRTSAIVTSASCDFATGGLAEIGLDDFAVKKKIIGTVESDAVVRVQDERVFVINRFAGSSVQEIARDGSLATLWRCSVGAGSNPHDIVLVAPDKAYVSRYDAISLAIVDPSVGPSCKGFVRGTIDLSAFADGDGIPEMDQMLLISTEVFVAVQRLDRNNFFRPATNGALVVIDTTTDSVVDTIELTITNPFTETKGITYDEKTGHILVGGPGTLFSDLGDGGIEAVDPIARASAGVLLSGTELGGDLMDFTMLGSRRGFAVVADASFQASVVEFDAASGVLADPVLTSAQNLSDVEALADGTLWVVDRNCFDPGIRVFRVSDAAEITSEPVYPGLTPFTLDFVR